jgi:hypothetical protein
MPRPFNLTDTLMTDEKVCRHKVKQVVTDLQSNNIDWGICGCCFHPFSLKHDTNASPMLLLSEARELPDLLWGEGYWEEFDLLPPDVQAQNGIQFCGRCNETGKVNTFAHWASSYWAPGEPHIFRDKDPRPVEKVVTYWIVWDRNSYESTQDWRLQENEAWATSNPERLYDTNHSYRMSVPFIDVSEHSGNFLKKKDAEAERQRKIDQYIERERQRLAALEKKLNRGKKAASNG